jgi:hypothetical protein
MKKKSPPISMFILIAVGGLVISVLNGDYDIGSYFEGLDVSNTKVLLDYINLGLGFLVLAGVFIFIMVRAAKDDKEYFWDFTADDFKDDEEE